MTNKLFRIVANINSGYTRRIESRTRSLAQPTSSAAVVVVVLSRPLKAFRGLNSYVEVSIATSSSPTLLPDIPYSSQIPKSEREGGRQCVLDKTNAITGKIHVDISFVPLLLEFAQPVKYLHFN